MIMAPGENDGPTPHKKASPAARARRPNKNALYVYSRTSPLTGVVSWSGDFRRYSDVGGRQESLDSHLEPGEAKVSDLEHAKIVYYRVVAVYKQKREAAASTENWQEPCQRQVPEPTAAVVAGSVRNRLLAPAAAASQAQTAAVTSTVNAPASMSPEVASLFGRLGQFLETAEAAAPTIKGTELRLQESAAAYLQRKRTLAARDNGRDSTVDTDATNFKALFRLLRGDTLLKDITVPRLEDYITARLAEPGWGNRATISTATVRNELHSLSGLFTDLVRRGEYSLANPVTNVVKPPPPDDEAEYLQLAECARLLDACAAIDEETERALRGMSRYKEALEAGARGRPRTPEERTMIDESFALYPLESRKEQWDRRFPYVEPLVASMLYSGGRHEEIRGLCAEEIDLDAATMRIQDNEWRKLKTPDSNRTVDMPAEWVTIMRRHIAITKITKGLLFVGATGGMTGSLQTIFQRAVNLAQIERRITPKALRHTFATAMLNTYTRAVNGDFVQRSCLLVAQMLGHTDSEMVRTTYGHLVWQAGMMVSFSLNHLRGGANAGTDPMLDGTTVKGT